MTLRTAKPEVPRHLPNARLYLDDIEQITELFSEIAQPLKNETTQPIKFEVENQITAEVSDLPKIGAKTWRLRISYYSDGLFLLFDVHPWAGINWWSEGLPYAIAWQTHHQLEEILKRRPLHFLDCFPPSGPHAIITWIMLAVVSALVPVKRFLPHPHPQGQTAYILIAALLLVLAALLLVMRFLAFRTGPSLVILEHSYKNAARRQDLRSAIWVATISAVLGFVGGAVFDAFVLKFIHR